MLPEDIYLNQTGNPGGEASYAVSRQDVGNAVRSDVIEHNGVDVEVFIFKDGSVAYWEVSDDSRINTGNPNIEKEVYERYSDIVGPDVGRQLDIDRSERGSDLLEREGYVAEVEGVGLGKEIRKDLYAGYPLSVIRRTYGVDEQQFTDILKDAGINSGDIEKYEHNIRLKLSDRDIDTETYQSLYDEHERLKARIADNTQPEDQVFSLSDVERSVKRYPGLPVDKDVVRAIGARDASTRLRDIQNRKMISRRTRRRMGNSIPPEDQYLADPRMLHDYEQQKHNRLMDRYERRRVIVEERNKQRLENDELSFDSLAFNGAQNHEDEPVFDSVGRFNGAQPREDEPAFDSVNAQNYAQPREDEPAFDSVNAQNYAQPREDEPAFDSVNAQNYAQPREDEPAFDSVNAQNYAQPREDEPAFDSVNAQNYAQPREDEPAFDSQNTQNNSQSQENNPTDSQNNTLVESIVENNPVNNYEKSVEQVFDDKNRDNSYEEGIENTFGTDNIDDTTEREVDKIFSGEYSYDESEDNSKKSDNKDSSLDSMVSNATDSLKSVIPVDVFDKDSKNNKKKDDENDDESQNVDIKTPDIEVEIEKSLSSDDMTKVTNEQLLNQFVDDIKKYDATTEEQLKERAEAYDNALRTNALFRKQVACGYVIRHNSDTPDKPLYPSQEKAIKDKVDNIYDDSNKPKENNSDNNNNEENEDDFLKNIRKNLDKKKNELDNENKGIDDETVRNKLQQLSEKNNPQQNNNNDGFDDSPKSMAGKMRKGKRFRGRGVDLNNMNTPQQMGNGEYIDPDEQILETGVLASMRKRMLESNGIDPSKVAYQTSSSVWA